MAIFKGAFALFFRGRGWVGGLPSTPKRACALLSVIIVSLRNSNKKHEELEKKLLDQMVEHLHTKEKEFREEIEKKVRMTAVVLVTVFLLIIWHKNNNIAELCRIFRD